jgi:hypothetical protein
MGMVWMAGGAAGMQEDSYERRECERCHVQSDRPDRHCPNCGHTYGKTDGRRTLLRRLQPKLGAR